MNDLSPMSDLIADDLFLDRLAGRVDAGSEPLAGLLGALATQADTPLPSRTGRRRIANKHRYLGAFAALAVAASGAGVAAAVNLPSNGPSQADRARIVKMMDESARSSAPSALLARLGIPQTVGTMQASGLVLARRDDGTIVLLPAAMVAGGRPQAGAGQTEASGVAGNVQGGSAVTGNRQADHAANGNGQGGTGSTGGSDVAGGTTAGQGGGQGGQGGSTQTGTPQATNSAKKPATATKGGRKATPTSTVTTSQALVPQTTLAPATTSSSAARVTGASPTTSPQAAPTPKTMSGTTTSAVLGVVRAVAPASSPSGSASS